MQNDVNYTKPSKFHLSNSKENNKKYLNKYIFQLSLIT